MDMSISEIVKIAAEEGAKAALKKFDDENTKRAKMRKDMRLKNAKLLLKNYKIFKKHSEQAIYQAEQAEDEVLDILDLMWDQNNKSDAIVESIKKSALKTKLIVTHIEKMLDVYKYLCTNSNNETEERKYNVLFENYIAEERKPMVEIAELYNIDKRTAYRDLDAAVDDMSKLIFGIDFLDSGKK